MGKFVASNLSVSDSDCGYVLLMVFFVLYLFGYEVIKTIKLLDITRSFRISFCSETHIFSSYKKTYDSSLVSVFITSN